MMHDLFKKRFGTSMRNFDHQQDESIKYSVEIDGEHFGEMGYQIEMPWWWYIKCRSLTSFMSVKK